MIDLEAMLRPIDGATPSGGDLRYSPEFAELERALTGKPERALGTTVVAAEPPDWRGALEKATALLNSSKDLRVAVAIARSLLELQGFAGFADGLALTNGIVTAFWDSLHPQLDAEDNNDPTARVNAMAELTRRDLVHALQKAPLVQSRVFGSVTLRTIEAAMTAAKAPSDDAPKQQGPTMAAVEGAFKEVPFEALTASHAAIARCVAEARTLADQWGERLSSAGPDFTEVRRVLAQAEQAVRTRMEQRQPAPVAEGADGANGAAAGNGDGASAAAAESRERLRGEVHSREDVLRAIDAICAYYARYEPSSPVPLLLERCKRMVTMSFVDILKEMLPDSIQTLQKITGKAEGS